MFEYLVLKSQTSLQNLRTSSHQPPEEQQMQQLEERVAQQDDELAHMEPRNVSIVFVIFAWRPADVCFVFWVFVFWF